MPTRKNDGEKAVVKESAEPRAESAERGTPHDLVEQRNAQHGEQLAELRELVESLALAFQASQARAAKDDQIRDAVNEIRQTARAMSVGAPAPAAVRSPVMEGNRGECGCDCTAPDCCAFDIKIRSVRATRPQIEPPDMGDVPFLQNPMEVRFYVTANGIGVLVPSLACTLNLRADGLPPGPGPEVVLNTVINRIYVKKGSTQIVQLRAEVEEDDTPMREQAVAAGKNEFGEASGTIALNCCMEEIYAQTPLDVDLRYGGEGRGSVQLLVYAERVCC